MTTTTRMIFDNPRRDFLIYANQAQGEDRQFMLDCAKAARGTGTLNLDWKLERRCTQQDNVTGFIGVHQYVMWDGHCRYGWRLNFNGKNHRHSGYLSALAAAIEREQLAIEIGVERERLNFPQGIPEKATS